MSRCQFIIAAPGLLTCTTCNVPQPSTHPPESTYRTCRPERRAAVEQLACIHRGPQLGTVACELAGCRSQIKVYSCALLQECTLSANVPSKPFCGQCDERTQLPY
jgi:hypothetical protein